MTGTEADIVVLTKETDRNFIVYPSWAELAARWVDLPRHFADPLRSGFLEPDFDYRRFGYPETIQRHELIDGPVGGGIVVWWGDPYGGRFLPLRVLSGSKVREPADEPSQFLRGANILEPNGVRNLSPDHNPHAPWVCFLEPYENRYWRLGIGKRTPMYNTSLSFEHVDAAEESVYWVVRYKRPRVRARDLPGLADLPEWSRTFGVDARRLDGPPAEVRQETDPWFTNAGYESAWFHASCEDTGLGYQFAVVVYIGNHLRHVAGAAMDSMHLIARIEGRPNFRHRWTRKN